MTVKENKLKAKRLEVEARNIKLEEDKVAMEGQKKTRNDIKAAGGREKFEKNTS